MIFNLNEQKVLSDPSGSSVFKGEKDFNDIVVNLPDNIDGHTATELNYVMHFVDSDGGYSTKILTVDSSSKTLKATATVSTSITSKAQAFYAYVLMTDDEETVIGKTNGVIVMIHPVPDEENEIIPPADADKIIKGLEEIVKEATETIEEATEAISSKQDKLTAGDNITIENNVISAEGGGVTSYEELTDKPYVRATNVRSGTVPALELTKGIWFDSYNFEGVKTVEDEISINISNLFYRFRPDAALYNFNNIDQFFLNGVFEFKYASDVRNFPADLDEIDRNKPFYVCHDINSRRNIGDSARPMIRRVIGQSATGEYLEYAQFCECLAFNGNITQQTNWAKISGGSQIISGVVNANGTITFTDSNGNTFTTTGSSVIGEDGFSPVATVTQTASGATISITDSTGTTTANISNGQDGNDYVLTNADKQEIAQMAVNLLPNADSVSY